MDRFYSIVLIVAIIVLIVILAYIGMQISSNAGQDTPYPPQHGHCPDYWESIERNNINVCQIPSANDEDPHPNLGSIYENGQVTLTTDSTPGYDEISNTIDFDDKKWYTGPCMKKKWANQFSIIWDGVSNYNDC
jgi:hypothetical protein|uniref:CPW-WPC domain-containing protein n=1 Tax=viral metagenome TaxID=1070528 RepID=A0A6C0IJC6_9ZZZZ